LQRQVAPQDVAGLPPPLLPPRRGLFARLGLGGMGMIVRSCAGFGALAFSEIRQQEQNYPI
jgi:hypothetical protein